MQGKNKNIIRVLLGAIILGMGGFWLFSAYAEAATGINRQINFQGKVTNTDGTNVTNGSYTFLFCLYTTGSPATACTSGADNDAVWRESKSITVTDGIFQTDLGDTTALPGSVDFNTDNIYLGINFNANGQMTPLVRFTAAPYAMNADKVHGLTVTDTTGTLTVANGKTVSFADAFSTSGAFPMTLTATASTTATLPSGTITIADLATSQTLTNKTIGSTGLVFSGATTDITTASGESLVLSAAGAGIVDIQDALTADSLSLDAGSITLQNSEVIGNGTDDLVTFAGAGGTDNTDLYLDLDGTSPVLYSNTDIRVSVTDFLNIQVSGETNAAAGDIWYDSAAGKFKVNEGGTTKTLCNTTDLGCSAGGALTVRETDATPSVSSVTAIEFGPTGDSTADFVVTDQTGGVARVVLGSSVAHINVAETVTGGWTFGTATTNFTSTIDARGDISDSTGNLTLNDAVDISGALAVSGTSLTATSATTVTLGSTGADAIILGNGGADTITIGNAASTGVSITDNNWSVTAAGAATFSGITAAGTVSSGTWQGTAIAAQYGGTGINTSASTGVPIVTSGIWSVSSTLGPMQGGTGTNTMFDSGSVVFASVAGIYGQDNAYFFYDNANHRLGLGDTTPDAVLDLNLVSTSAAAGTEYGSTNTVSDTGIVTTGTDTTYGDYLSVTRTGATGGTISNYGQYISLTGDTGGASTNTGLYVNVGGADANYAAVFNGGFVGVNTTSAGYAAFGVLDDGTSYEPLINVASAYIQGIVGAGSAVNFVVRENAANIETELGSTNPGGGYVGTATNHNFAIKTNDTDKMTVLSGGNVGIGDASPDSLFELLSTVAPQFRISYTDGSVDGTVGVTSAETLMLEAGTTAETRIVQIGAGSTGSDTPDYFALDVKSTSGDPAAAGFEGAMYYNTADNKFRCYQGSGWVDCIATGGSVSWDTVNDAAASGAIAMAEYAQTMDWNTAATAAAFDGLTVTITNDATTDTNTQRAFVVANLNDAAATGTTETIMQVDNRDINETVGSGITIENTGAGTMTTALEILETAGTITTGISIGDVTTGISIGTGVTTGISIASGGITSTGETLLTNTGTGLSLRVNDASGDTTPMVVDADGNVGIGTAAPSRALDVFQTAAAPQLRLSKDLTYYSEFTVDSVGDLQMAATGSDIRALSENLWICDNDACPALTLTGDGNIFVENVLKFGNGVYLKNDSSTELSVYDANDQAMLIFDQL